MALIKREPTSQDVALRHPNCHERVPRGARQCTMCGRRRADVATDAARERAREAQER